MNTSTQPKLHVANEILHQLGGNKFIMMTGAKYLAGTENSLSFKIMRNDKGITHVKIVLNALDLYDMTFYKIRGRTIKEHTINGIYNDMLQDIFTRETGLNTYL